MHWSSIIPLLKIRLYALVQRRGFSSYQDVLKKCNPKGYENEIIPKTVFLKTKKFKDDLENGMDYEDQPTRILMNAIYNFIAHKPSQPVSQEIHVLDFGGACGAHYFSVRKLLSQKWIFKWTVIETPSMCEYGNQLANEELSFVSDLNTFKEMKKDVDIIHTSGALQSVEHPLAILEELIAFDAPLILFNRFGFVQGDNDVVTLHKSLLSWNGIGQLPEGIKDQVVSYPYTFMSEKTFYDALDSKYRCIGEFDDKSGFYKVKNESIVGGALLYKKK